MSSCSSRIIFLTGAPDQATLDARSEKLLADFEPAFQVFLQGKELGHCPSPFSDRTFAKWRSIGLQGQADRSALNAAHKEHTMLDRQTEETQVYRADVHQEDPAFLEQSFIANEEMTEAIAASLQESHRDGNTSISTACTPSQELSFMTSIHGLHDKNDEPGSILDLALSRLVITDLGALPSAQHLTRLYPQTVTPSFLAGIISISAPRTVTIRPQRADQSTRHMDIVELLLGDNTAAGFSVSFWLPASSDEREHRISTRGQEHKHTNMATLRQQLSTLRCGDLVLLAHVALSSFRGKVYGQSLRSRVGSSVGTKIFSIPATAYTSNSVNAQKIRSVRTWIHDFVGPPIRATKRRRVDEAEEMRFNRRIRLDEDLPEDTQ